MTRPTILFLFLVSFNAHGQGANKRLVGTFAPKNNAFEQWSVLTLQGDQRFTYNYGVGGCQDEISGTWDVKGKKLIMTNDKKFLNHDTIFYPDMSLTTWTIKKKGVKPNGSVDSGCIKETRLHSKRE